MVIKLVTFGFRNDLFKKASEVRLKVFVKEMGIDPNIDFDTLDIEAAHYLMLVDDKPVGTARTIETKEGIAIERLSIIPEYRRIRLGSVLLKFVINDVLPTNKTIYLFSPEDLKYFFMLNGFEQTDQKLEINNKPHVKMKYIVKEKTRLSFIKKLFKK